MLHLHGEAIRILRRRFRSRTPAVVDGDFEGSPCLVFVVFDDEDCGPCWVEVVV